MRSKNNEEIRIIKTARDIGSINAAAREGFFPLVKAVLPSNKIRSKIAIYQNKHTGEISSVGDFRSSPNPDYHVALDFMFYYPHSFPSPFAAYLIPKDIQKGEVVLLEDLIEDVVATRWNQGDAYRLSSCQALWNGSDFEILFKEERDTQQIIG